jgi:hypothetical protein
MRRDLGELERGEEEVVELRILLEPSAGSFLIRTGSITRSNTDRQEVFLSVALDFRKLAQEIDLYIILAHAYRQTSRVIVLP